MRLSFWYLSFVASTIAISAQPQRHVITSVAANSTQHYDVVSGPCKARRCSLTVELLSGDRVTDSLSLEMESSTSEFRKTKLRRGDGFGDPSLSNSDSMAWYSGEDEDETALTVTPFLLEPGSAGVLLDERAGFEHVKRHHALVAARNNRLVKLWQGSEGAGPTFSTVAPVEISQGRQSLLFYSFFDSPDDQEPDKLILKSLVYDHGSGSMVRYVQSFTALLVGPFPTVAAAREQRSGHRSCVGTLRVLPAKGFEQTTGGYVLSTITPSSSVASSFQARIAACKVNGKVSLVPINKDGIDLW